MHIPWCSQCDKNSNREGQDDQDRRVILSYFLESKIACKSSSFWECCQDLMAWVHSRSPQDSCWKREEMRGHQKSTTLAFGISPAKLCRSHKAHPRLPHIPPPLFAEMWSVSVLPPFLCATMCFEITCSWSILGNRDRMGIYLKIYVSPPCPATLNRRIILVQTDIRHLSIQSL